MPTWAFGSTVSAQAIDRGAGFCAKLLERLAGPELHERLVDVAIEDLHALPEPRRAQFKEGWRDGNPGRGPQ
ncbi:hypothetical protein [Methylococcus sp. EFPC2]|uniref:hypothetical protein n=1 Tax=Methylococcus sp. EFPC2 TaxID=2812648 RepID=UPI0019680065|nr:hypothetical protein [Methylococcus sp. EFPC2]QSA97774.1 hypothetical protein JWZ97_02780 [Methylococcus sp. EFPC2]